MVHVTLVKPNVTQMLDVINIIIQLNVQNHQNTFKAAPTTLLHGLLILNAPTNTETRKNLEALYIAL